MSEPDDEHSQRVRRGALPTPKSEVERAPRFAAKPTNADDADGDTTGTDEDAETTPPSGSDDPS